MIELYEPELIPGLSPAQDTTVQKWAAFHREHPEIFDAIRSRAFYLLRGNPRRISMKKIFEDLRGLGELFGREGGLNNSYTSLYTDELVAREPVFEGKFLRRHRAAKRMRLVNVR